MSDLLWLTEAQMERLKPFFPLSHGKPRVDDRKVLSGIVFISCNGLRWRDAPDAYGPPKALYNRWVRWSRLGVFARIQTELAAEGREGDTLMIDATHLKAHRTASSLRGKRGVQSVRRTEHGRAELQAAYRDRWKRAADRHVADSGPDIGLHRGAGAAIVAADGEKPVGRPGL